jgi:hypothetical protein
MTRAAPSALTAVLLLASSAAAQQQVRTETSLLLGPAPYDLSGTGTGFAAKLGVTSRLGRGVFLIEPSIGYFAYTTQFGGRSQWIFPELGVEAEAPLGSLRPYLGTGIGAGFETRAGPNQVEFTMHAAAGLRLRLGGSWGARAEARLRSVDPFAGNTTDIGFGITRGIY